MFDARFLTRSRRSDILVFVTVLAVMLLLSPRLRVYYKVTAVAVTLEQVWPDGRRTSLPTPAEFDRPGNGYWSGDSLVRRLTPAIDLFMQSSPVARDATAGTRFEWTIRWSDTSSTLNHSQVIVREARHGDR